MHGTSCVYNMYIWKQPLEEFFEKDVLKSFANFTGKHLFWSLFFNKVTGLRACSFIKKRLQHRCVPVKLAKFYEHLFEEQLQTTADQMICNKILLQKITAVFCN